MDKYLSNIWSASAELEMIRFQTDQAHERLVQALCEAMAARISPAAVATAANMSLSELFDTLRRRRTIVAAETAAELGAAEAPIHDELTRLTARIEELTARIEEPTAPSREHAVAEHGPPHPR